MVAKIKEPFQTLAVHYEVKRGITSVFGGGDELGKSHSFLPSEMCLKNRSIVIWEGAMRATKRRRLTEINHYTSCISPPVFRRPGNPDGSISALAVYIQKMD